MKTLFNKLSWFIPILEFCIDHIELAYSYASQFFHFCKTGSISGTSFFTKMEYVDWLSSFYSMEFLVLCFVFSSTTYFLFMVEDWILDYICSEPIDDEWLL